MEDQLVTIMRFTKLFELLFVKEEIELEGIECFLTDEGFHDPDDESTLGWNLKVRTSEVEKTVKLLLKISRENDLENLQETDIVPDRHKILVPIDLNSYSINTCKFVLGIADTVHAEVEFLYILDDPNLAEHLQYRTSWEAFEKIEREEAYENAHLQLQKFSNEIKKLTGQKPLQNARFHFALHAGKLEPKIVDLSQHYNPDLIIMEQKTRDTKERIHLTRVTHFIIDHTPFPVLTVPEDHEYKDLQPIKIMYATDLHDPDHSAIDKLIDILAPFETKISCIHLDVEHSPITQEQIDVINMFMKKKYSDFDIQAFMYESSDVTLGVNEFIKKNEIDWISLPAHKRNFIYKIFHSDILNKMMLASKVPMLIYRIP